MRTTIVPAQITTVEDKIAGNLGLSQILLLIAPVFGGSGIFVLLPPFYAYAAYKVAVIVVVALLCGMLAVRIKGTIVLVWGITLLRYNMRPTYYVFDKNSMFARDMAAAITSAAPVLGAVPQTLSHTLVPKLNVAEIMALEDIITNPSSHLHFKASKKGAISVHLNEATRESLG